MFAARGFRLTALLLVLLTTFSLVAIDTAEARRGGSFGSRGTRTYQTVPATPTSPAATAPVQRSMTSPDATRTGAQATQAGAAAQRSGMFGGIGGMILGGLLFSGLFGMLFGGGFGGFGGFIALIVQVMILFFVFRFFFGRRIAAAGGPSNGPTGGTNFSFNPRQDWQPGGGSRGQRQGAPASGASQRAGHRDEVGVGEGDLATFEQRLAELQDAYAREDYEGLRRITTPEMMGYLAEELGSNASRGVRNEVYDVKLLSGDIAEAWREGADEYATVAMRYESRDVTRERATGRIVEGDEAMTETTEIWTFLRRPGEDWRVSAIQEK